MTKKLTDQIENSHFTLICLKCMRTHPHLVLFYFVCNHSELVLKCVSTSCPSRTNTVPWWILQPGASLFAIRVLLVLAVLAQWPCGWFWKCSRTTVAGRGLFPTTHVAAIKRRKGPCSTELCYCLLEIPWSRCHSVWIHFHLAVEKKWEGKEVDVSHLKLDINDFYVLWHNRI